MHLCGQEGHIKEGVIFQCWAYSIRAVLHWVMLPVSILCEWHDCRVIDSCIHRQISMEGER